MAGHAAAALTGGAGGDTFVFGVTPWNAGHITDFTVGVDRIDLSPLFAASGYSGVNPVGDGDVTLASDGAGGTNIFYDIDGPAGASTIQFKIVDIDNVAPTTTWAQLTGGGTSSPSGLVLTANDFAGQSLVGGSRGRHPERRT